MAVAAIGGELVDDLVSLDQVDAVKSLAQLARLGVTEVGTLADGELVSGRSDERCLDLARPLATVEAKASGKVRTRQPRVIHTHSQSEEIELVAADVACSITAAAAARYTPHPGVRYVPIADIPGSSVVLAWRRDRTTRVAKQFIASACSVRDREHQLTHWLKDPFGERMPT